MFFRRTKKRYTNLKRLQEITNILIHHGFGYIVSRANLSHYRKFGRFMFKKRFHEESPAVRLRLVLEELGPTFVKFGQLLSLRPDIIPESYIKELNKLQDSVSPVNFLAIQKQLQKELSRPVEEVYKEFALHPMASASIAQVHSAVLLNGQEVVVKIQRPSITRVIESDLDILRYFAILIERRIPELKVFNPVKLVEEFSRTIKKELDFTREGRNIDRFIENFKHEPTVHFPKVYWDYSTEKILTMEKIRGIKISNVDEIEKSGLDKVEIALNGARGILKQIFIDGFFHGDPHPGNIRVLENNVIAYLDLGIVGRLDDEAKQKIADLIISIMNKDYSKMVDILFNMGILNASSIKRGIKRDIVEFIDKYYGLSLKQLSIAKIVKEIFQLMKHYQILLPTDYIMMFKALVTAEAVGRKLNPDFNLNEEIKPYARELMKKKFSVFGAWNETSDILTEFINLAKILPKETKYILKKIKAGTLKIEFEHMGLENLINTFNKVSIRISLSLVIAALIVGSSLIMQTDKGALLFDFPMLGMVTFIFTFLCIIWLLIAIIRSR
jgi:ubiquinone biosynthesis protein